MIWAESNGEKILATKGAAGQCPGCHDDLIPKCGSIVTWHWAHRNSDCDPWYEPESEWHIGWKSRFPKDWQEVVMPPHRADVKTPTTVIEFQSSSISAEQIRAREDFYGNMIWVLRGEDFSENFRTTWRVRCVCKSCCQPFNEIPSYRCWCGDTRVVLVPEGHQYFRWKHPRKTWLEGVKPVFIDMGDRILRIVRFQYDSPCRGWVKPMTLEQFLSLHGAPPQLPLL